VGGSDVGGTRVSVGLINPARDVGVLTSAFNAGVTAGDNVAVAEEAPTDDAGAVIGATVAGTPAVEVEERVAVGGFVEAPLPVGDGVDVAAGAGVCVGVDVGVAVGVATGGAV